VSYKEFQDSLFRAGIFWSAALALSIKGGNYPHRFNDKQGEGPN